MDSDSRIQHPALDSSLCCPTSFSYKANSRSEQTGLRPEGVNFRLKRADRFWYEREENGFNPEQLDEIKQTSLAR